MIKRLILRSFMIYVLIFIKWYSYCQPLIISPNHGDFLDKVTITAKSNNPDAKIYYSINSNYWNDSKKKPILYKDPIKIERSSMIHFWLAKDSDQIGDKITAMYHIFKSATVMGNYNWEPQPKKAAIMLIFAHPDDEIFNFSGILPYYAKVRKIPMVAICMANSNQNQYDRWRRKELEKSFKICGMPNPPIYANFKDTCGNKHLFSCNLNAWDFEKTVEYLTSQIRKYKPDVIITHDFYGDYNGAYHINHMVTAIAAYDAFKMAGDETKFPSQLDSLSTWNPKKLYNQYWRKNVINFTWNQKYPELNGKSPHEVAGEAIKSHYSQNIQYNGENGKTFGLLLTKVGLDVKKDDFLENIDLSIYK